MHDAIVIFKNFFTLLSLNDTVTDVTSSTTTYITNGTDISITYSTLCDIAYDAAIYVSYSKLWSYCKYLNLNNNGFSNAMVARMFTPVCLCMGIKTFFYNITLLYFSGTRLNYNHRN